MGTTTTPVSRLLFSGRPLRTFPQVGLPNNVEAEAPVWTADLWDQDLWNQDDLAPVFANSVPSLAFFGNALRMPSSDPTARELFEILVRENGDALLASIRATGGAAHADDIFQETVLVAWRRMADYDRTRPFGPWLRGIARLVAMDMASKRARLHVADPTTLDAIEQDFSAFDRYRGSATEPAMSFRERLNALEDCLTKLPAVYADAVQAVYRDTRTLRAVAHSIGENEEAIKKRLQRARSMLAQCLSGKGAFGDELRDIQGETA